MSDVSKHGQDLAISTPISPQLPSSSTARAPAVNGPPSSTRHRHPVPPSPLSRIQSEPGHSSIPSHRAATQALAETSPCFIHSHLDRHGSMQDWLKSKSNHPSPNSKNQSRSTPTQNGSKPSRSTDTNNLARPLPHPHSHSHHKPRQDLAKSPTLSSGGSNAPSPTPRGPSKESPGSGYSSDKSSNMGGSAILDGDLMDDEEEASSLTRQLAETAQGVREMSKELGRTRVRSKIQHILIVTKARDNRLIKLTRELALYLMLKKPASSSDQPSRPGPNERGIVVYVDAQLRSSKRFDAAGIQREYPQLFEPVGRRRSSSTTSMSNLSAYPSSASLNEAGKRRDEGQLRYWTGEMCSNSPHLFDFVVTLGGDGTVLFTSWLFQRIVPPVLPFALGSLGFLTCFDFAKYKSTMDRVIDDGIRVNLRMRFTCTVYRAIAPEEAAQASAKGNSRKAIKKPGGEILMSQVDRSGWEALEGPAGMKDGENCVAGGKDKEIMCFSTRPVEQFEVLNDLVVDRGPSPFVSLLELFGDEHHLTTVQADGLTVSTPTGSTAYSLSAGGSLVHPQIPAILITPICPHTLSFRPMLLPDSMELRICVPYNSRSTAWASFDGRGRVELKQGDHIKVTASKYPFPTVCADKASTDWFNSISRTLRWNEREKQKSFVVIEEDNEPAASTNKSKKRAGSSWEGAKKGAERTHEELREEDEDAIHGPEGAGGVDGNEEEKEEDEDEDEEEEDEFDIDDKSGGEKTNPSSPMEKPTDPRIPLLSQLDPGHHKSGVDSPDRFAKPYQAPPPLSQRHLVEALAAADIDSKDGEVGQRDEIRSGPGEMRIDGAHLIPSGRSVISGGSDDSSSDPLPSSTQPQQQEDKPKRNYGRSVSEISGVVSRPGNKRKETCKAKAFAFFGQDDSASDMSDEASEA